MISNRLVINWIVVCYLLAMNRATSALASEPPSQIPTTWTIEHKIKVKGKDTGQVSEIQTSSNGNVTVKPLRWARLEFIGKVLFWVDPEGQAERSLYTGIGEKAVRPPGAGGGLILPLAGEIAIDGPHQKIFYANTMPAQNLNALASQPFVVSGLFCSRYWHVITSHHQQRHLFQPMMLQDPQLNLRLFQNFPSPAELNDIYAQGFWMAHLACAAEPIAGHRFGFHFIKNKTGSAPFQLVWNQEFPYRKVWELIQQGFAITDIAYGQNNWWVLMHQGTGRDSTVWRIDGEFPHRFIQDNVTAGRQITSICWADGYWAVVLATCGAGGLYDTQMASHQSLFDLSNNVWNNQRRVFVDLTYHEWTKTWHAITTPAISQ
jgi:hypothetical protein